MRKILAAMGHGICIRHDLVLNEGNTYMRAMAEAANVPIHREEIARRIAAQQNELAPHGADAVPE